MTLYLGHRDTETQRFYVIHSTFGSMLMSCNSKPHRGLIGVASHFRSALCDASHLKNGWYAMTRDTRAFRYATTNPYRVPTARIPFATPLPANELAGYPYQMPMALLAKLE